MCMWWGIWLQTCTYATIYEPEGCTSQWRGPQELCTTHRNRVQWHKIAICGWHSTPWHPNKEKGFVNRFIGKVGQWYVPVLYQKKHCKFTLSTNNKKISGNVISIFFFVQITSIGLDYVFVIFWKLDFLSKVALLCHVFSLLKDFPRMLTITYINGQFLNFVPPGYKVAQ